MSEHADSGGVRKGKGSQRAELGGEEGEERGTAGRQEPTGEWARDTGYLSTFPPTISE